MNENKINNSDEYVIIPHAPRWQLQVGLAQPHWWWWWWWEEGEEQLQVFSAVGAAPHTCQKQSQLPQREKRHLPLAKRLVSRCGEKSWTKSQGSRGQQQTYNFNIRKLYVIHFNKSISVKIYRFKFPLDRAKISELFDSSKSDVALPNPATF